MPPLTYVFGPAVDAGSGKPQTRLLRRHLITRSLIDRLPPTSCFRQHLDPLLDDGLANLLLRWSEELLRANRPAFRKQSPRLGSLRPARPNGLIIARITIPIIDRIGTRISGYAGCIGGAKSLVE
jgi:hypothetical protein